MREHIENRMDIPVMCNVSKSVHVSIPIRFLRGVGVER